MRTSRTLPTPTRTLAIALVTMCAAYACGGGDGPDTGPVTSAEAQAPCTKLCEAEQRCGSTQPVGECAMECATSLDGWARADALTELADCFATLACEGDGDTCLAMIEPLDEHRAWSSRCTTQLASCPEIDVATDCSIEPGAGDAGFIVVIAPEIVAEMTACLDGADCTARISCVDGVFDRYGIDL